jgi:hypothetical protein
MDVEAVCDARARARAQAVVGQGPTILEMETYRYSIRPSSRLTCEPIAGWLSPSRSPAFDKLPVSEIATTVRTISIGIFKC